MFGHMIFSHEKYHHDVNVQHFLFMLCLIFVIFSCFFMFFMIFHVFFNESAGASLVQVCCELAPLYASLMPLGC